MANTTDNGPIDERPEVKVVLTLLTCLLILFFNTIVLYAIGKHRLCSLEYRFIFLTHMAVFDFLLGLALIPFIPLNRGWIKFGDKGFLALCYFSAISTSLVATGTIVNLLALTIDQYIRIAYPLRYPLLVTKGRIKVTVTVCWLLTIGNGVAWSFAVDESVDAEHYCIDYTSGYYMWHAFVTNLVIPFSIMITLQVRILIIAKGHVNSHRHKGFTGRTTAPAALHQWRLAVTTAIILGALFVCWMPYFIALLIRILRPEVFDTKSGVWFDDFVGFLYFANSYLNPIIYGVRVPQIKREFSRILCKPCCVSASALN